MTKITQINMDFPINQTFEYSINDLEKIKMMNFLNKNVHLKLSIDKLLKKDFNQAALEQEIKNATKASLIKISFIYNQETNVRSKEVTEQNNIIDKWKSYANINNIKYTDTLIEKLQTIQNNMLLESFIPHETFTLEYMSLRGSIGLSDGQGIDEVEFNFAEDYEDGIIGITGPSGSGKCITGNSIILGENGFERLNKYALPKKSGFTPMQKTLYTQKGDKSTSSHFYSEDVNKTIKITNSLGMSLEGTPDHPVLIFNSNCIYEFKKLKDLNVGDYVCVPRGMNVFPSENKPFYRYIRPKSRNASNHMLPTIMTEELARFLGYYVANGAIDNNRIEFSSHNKNIANDYALCVKKVFGMDVSHDKDFFNYSFYSNQIKNFLSSLFGYPLKTARLKKIPLTILESTKECQKNFLRAYFDCDSSIYKNIFEFSTASKDCAEVVQNMLLNFGIISVHRTKRVKNYNWTYHNITISSSEIDILMNTIMDKSIKYKYSYNKSRNTNIDIIPFVKEFSYIFFNSRKNGMVKDDDLTYPTPCCKTTGKCASRSLLRRYVENAKKIQSKKCIEYVKKMDTILENNYFYSPIKDIKENNDFVTVYDFTIPSTHRFYSNGFISHNTTLLENMHPFPCMLTRPGTLREHFCLKDSHRILIYRTSSGLRYKITMNIPGLSEHSDPTYFVEKQEPGKEWESVRTVDSHKGSYLKWVESMFGTKELFLRTAFYTNAVIKDFPDLSQAGKTEKMALFSVLAGTDYLSSVSESAKKAIKDEEKIIEETKSQLKDFDNLEQRQTDNEKIIKDNNALIEKLNGYISDDAQELNDYKEKQKAFDTAKATYSIYQSRSRELTRQIADYDKQIVQYKNNIEAYNQSLENKDLYEEQLQWYEKNTAKRKELVTEESELRIKLYKLQSELTTRQAEYDKKKDLGNSLNKEIEVSGIKILNLKNAIPNLDGTCPVCGAPLSQHKKETLKREADDIANKINTLTEELHKTEANYNDVIEWLKNNSLDKLKEDISHINSHLMDISNDITAIDTYAAVLNMDEIRDVLNNAQKNLDNETVRLNNCLNEQTEAEKELNEIEEKLNTIPEDFSDKINRLERGIDDSKSKIAQASAEITMAEKELERISGAAEKVKAIKDEIKEHQHNIKDYELIQLGFSNNGIQALELASAAPEIQNIANSILLETYGDRFTISFDTERDAKDGRKINDFIINVFDARNARMKRLDLISSGEGTLIKQTLYYAFSVIRARRTGFCFKTRFLDESDSALDSKLRVKYLRMIEAAHKQCGATQTFIITHSQELKDIISQKIELLDRTED